MYGKFFSATEWIVNKPRTVSSVPFALKSALCVMRLLVVDMPLPFKDSNLDPRLKFAVHDSFARLSVRLSQC